jgi:hypothetical protein
VVRVWSSWWAAGGDKPARAYEQGQLYARAPLRLPSNDPFGESLPLVQSLTPVGGDKLARAYSRTSSGGLEAVVGWRQWWAGDSGGLEAAVGWVTGCTGVRARTCVGVGLRQGKGG